MKKNNMPAIQLGDIVLAPFPFADHSVTKLRPAIVISSLPSAAWLVIYVTSSLEDQTQYDVILEPNTTNNLKVSSVARVNRLTVISEDMIDRRLGTLLGKEKKKIGNKLEKVKITFLSNDRNV